jgi:hypothetical protein
MRTRSHPTTARLGIAVLVVSMLAIFPAPAAGQPDPVAHLDMAYVEQVVEDLTAIGSTDMGFRAFGTPQDLESAEYIADQMIALSLEDVALEPVVGDGWLFEGATVEVRGGGPDKRFTAGSMGGVPGTRADGVSGDLVFAGIGTARDYERLALDPSGKIVFAWWDPDYVWPNHMAYEAKARGAKALVIATPKGGSYYQGRGAIGSFDATCDLQACAPFVTISTRAANDLVERMASGARIRATVVLDATVTENATGYNTIGVIPGSAKPDKVIVLSAHHDAWWYGAVDATSGVGMMLALAKAVQDSGFQPRYTWVFASHTGEEYGIADAYYDWLYGAWYRITQEHPEWQSDAVAFVNWEGHAPPYELRVNLTRELEPLVDEVLGASGPLLPEGYELIDIYSWNEAWTFGAAGVPALTFASFGEYFDTHLYHTQLDTIEVIDFEGLAAPFEAEVEVVLALDRPVIYPYGFSTRIDALTTSLDEGLIEGWGYDAGSLTDGLETLTEAADAAAGATVSDTACFDDALREAARLSLTGFTALSAWDQTVYPHEQVQNDAWSLGKAIQALKRGDWRTANAWIQNVAQNWYVPFMGRESFRTEMSHHDPAYPKISWGGQGQLAPYLDLWNVFMKLRERGRAGATSFAKQIDVLDDHRDDERALWAERLDRLSATMQEVTAELTTAAAC